VDLAVQVRCGNRPEMLCDKREGGISLKSHSSRIIDQISAGSAERWPSCVLPWVSLIKEVFAPRPSRIAKASRRTKIDPSECMGHMSERRQRQWQTENPRGDVHPCYTRLVVSFLDHTDFPCYSISTYNLLVPTPVRPLQSLVNWLTFCWKHQSTW
jgi:hypothetical protein